MTIHTKQAELRELASRESDGIEVSLLWNPADNSVFVLVSDERTGDSFEVAIGDESPLDVFNHPYGYAASRGIDYVTSCGALGESQLAPSRSA